MSSEHGRIEPLPQDAAYKISGISNGAAREEIRRAYLEMCKNITETRYLIWQMSMR